MKMKAGDGAQFKHADKNAQECDEGSFGSLCLRVGSKTLNIDDRF